MAAVNKITIAITEFIREMMWLKIMLYGAYSEE
jgi:hypothetical protein